MFEFSSSSVIRYAPLVLSIPVLKDSRSASSCLDNETTWLDKFLIAERLERV